MAQLKSTTINGNLSVTGNFNYNNYWSGSLPCNSGYNASGTLWRIGNLVIGNLSFATNASTSIPPWNWDRTTMCPAGAVPSAFRPNGNRAQFVSLQEAGAGQMNFKPDGSITITTFNNFGKSHAGGLQIIYPIN